MNMIAAQKADQAKALAQRLREMADRRAIKNIAASTPGAKAEIRDTFADAVAELAQMVADIDWRQVS